MYNFAVIPSDSFHVGGEYMHEQDCGMPIPDYRDYDTQEAAERALRMVLRGVFLDGIGNNARVLHCEIRKGNRAVKKFDVARGSLICDKCFCIQPLDGQVFVPYDLDYSGKCSLVATAVGWCYGPLRRVLSVYCSRCGQVSGIDRVVTGVPAWQKLDELADGGLK